jgi:hypothetical protein
LPAESGDLSVKIKDIVREGFASSVGRVASSFGKALLPSQLQTTLQTLKANKRPLDPKERTELEPEYLELAKAAHAQYGDNPESVYPGYIGWIPPNILKNITDTQEQLAKQKDRQEKVRQADIRQQEKVRHQAYTKKRSQPAPASTIADKIRPAVTTAPTQVRLPSGQYVTKYGSSWYDDAGQRIVIPGDVERLERMARGPSGQSQMATTKNVPVDLPGFKGKRR